MANKDGAFVWYDLMTPDQNASRAFYTETVGWKTKEWDEMSYTMWAVGERTIGGMMDISEEARAAGAPPHWIGYIRTPDVAATTEKVEALGGKVMKGATEIPDMGAFAVVSDPDGAVFALYSGQDPGEDPEPGPGDFTWHELMAGDREKAWTFYQELFGWKKGEPMDMGEAGIYQLFEVGGRAVGGIMTKPKDMPAPPHWLYYVSVDNIDGALERIKKQGGQVVNGPMEVPGGDRVAHCLDPQGAAFAVHQRAE